MGFKTAAVWLCDYYEIETKGMMKRNLYMHLLTTMPLKWEMQLQKLEEKLEEGDNSYTRFASQSKA